MKFDFLIGNPPYQGDHHRQLYPYFYAGGREIADCIAMIFPVGWQGPKNGNNLKVLNTKDIKEDKQIVFIDNRQNVFYGVAGAEWTNIILWKRGYDNKLNGEQLLYTNGENPKRVKLHTEQQQWEFPELHSILQKIKDENFTCIMDILHLQTKMNLPQLFKDYPDTKKAIGSDGKDKRIITNTFTALPIFTNNKTHNNTILIYGTTNRSRVEKYMDYKYIEDSNLAIKKWKVLLPAAGYGTLESDIAMPIISKPFIGKPDEGFSQSFIGFGLFENEDMANKCLKYVKTKFFRIMVATLKTSQHNHSAVFANVPLQDFSDKSDIDWTKSISEIDEQLYKKYNLTEEEVSFIHKKISSMDDLIEEEDENAEIS